MFDIETAIANWRQRLSWRDAFTSADLDELESHLRDQIDALVANGLTEQNAFFQTIRSFGEDMDLAWRFNRANWEKVMAKRTRYAPVLLGNYLKVAVRNLLKHKLYSTINIAGLAIGLTCCLTIGLLIQDELSYDRFNKNADRIYRISTYPDRAGAYSGIGPKLVENFPEIERAVRLSPLPKTMVAFKDKAFYEDELLYTDSSFFDLFSFPLLKGDPETVLDSPDAIVITEQMAKRYFGDENPIGKALEIIDILGKRQMVHVTGILGKIPDHSHFTFQGLLPYNSNPVIFYTMPSTYLLLKKHTDIKQLREKLLTWLPQQIPENRKGSYAIKKKSPSGSPSISQRQQPFLLLPLTDIHLHAHLQGELGTNRDIDELYLFAAIGVLVLLIACINYMNLATARFANRAREVGLRKVVGASRKQLIQQFLSEALLITTFAFCLALLLTECFLPSFNAWIDRSIAMNYGGRTFIVLTFATLVISVLAGSYPAFFLSAFRPIDVLKAHRMVGPRNAAFRKGLVVFQFAVSIGLLSATGIVMRQLQFVKHKNLGFNANNDIVLPLQGIKLIDPRKWKASVLEHHLQAIKNELEQNPDILGVSLSCGLPGNSGWLSAVYTLKDVPDSEPKQMKTMYIDQDYANVLGLHFIAGKNITGTFSAAQNPLLLNESAARELGIGTTVGQSVTFSLIHKETGTIVGIVKDFHIRSLYHKIDPVVLRLEPDPNYIWMGKLLNLAVKIRPNTAHKTLSFLKEKWATLAPGYPFAYTFLDSYFDFDKLYRKETRLLHVFGAFSGLAVFVAFLGLFGLASFTAENRTREIGIRKVLGASVSGIIAMISKDFARLVIVAGVIAWPAAYYAVYQWLQNFAYRIDISWGIFALSGLLALILALLTVGYQTARAARANPVDALRNE